MYQLRNFAEIFGIIKNNYVRHIEDKKLLRNTMGGKYCRALILIVLILISRILKGYMMAVQVNLVA